MMSNNYSHTLLSLEAQSIPYKVLDQDNLSLVLIIVGLLIAMYEMNNLIQ